MSASNEALSIDLRTQSDTIQQKDKILGTEELSCSTRRLNGRATILTALTCHVQFMVKLKPVVPPPAMLGASSAAVH